MSAFLVAELMQVPSVRRFLEALLEDLSQRRSLLVLLPLGTDPAELWHALQDGLLRRDLYVREVLLPSLPAGTPPAAALGEVLGVEWSLPNSPRTVEHLVVAEGLPEIICLDGFSELSAEEYAPWIRFLVQWAQASQSATDRGVVVPALCLLAPARDG